MKRRIGQIILGVGFLIAGVLCASWVYVDFRVALTNSLLSGLILLGGLLISISFLNH